jgi:hypothetical protein
MEDFTNNTSQNPGGQSSTQGQRPVGGQNLGVAALITAIVTFVLAVIPCVGLIAIIPGLIAIVLAAIGLSRASAGEAPRGLLIAGLIIAAVASVISFSQIFVAGRIGNKFHRQWGDKIENVVNDVQENVLKDLENANVSIKIDSSGEKVEINASVGKQNREKELENLEKANTQSNDTLAKKPENKKPESKK